MIIRLATSSDAVISVNQNPFLNWLKLLKRKMLLTIEEGICFFFFFGFVLGRIRRVFLSFHWKFFSFLGVLKSGKAN